VDFFGDFVLQDTSQERIALKPIEIDIDKLCMKFLAFPVKVVILPLLASLS